MYQTKSFFCIFIFTNERILIHENIDGCWTHCVNACEEIIIHVHGLRLCERIGNIKLSTVIGAIFMSSKDTFVSPRQNRAIFLQSEYLCSLLKIGRILCFLAMFLLQGFACDRVESCKSVNRSLLNHVDFPK